MTRTPPPGASGSAVWQAFDQWATENHVPPSPPEEWEYLWSCYLAGAATGVKILADDVAEEIAK